MDKINNIGLSRLLTSVYDFDGFTEQEVWCRIAQKINIIIEHFNYLDKKIENEKENNKAKFDYLLGEGLTETVAKIILEKIVDGTIGELINDTLLKDINEQLDNIKQKRLTTNILYVDKEAGQFKTITEAIEYAKTHNAGKLYRYLIKINKGIYHEKFAMADGIDLEGVNNIDTIITYSGTGQRTDDTIFAPFDCSLKNLTVIQDSSLTTSDMQNYPIHIDGRPGEIVDYTVRLENCIFKSIGSFAHHALGAGLHGGQNIIVNNCEFHSDSKPAFFMHNWNTNEAKGCKIEINNSKIFGCKVNNISTNNYGLFLQDVGSGQYDEVKIYNTEIANLQNGYSIGLVKHDGFTGTRNTLIVKLIGCEYNNFYNEIDSGKIITDKDILGTSNTAIAYGKPCVINGYANNIPIVSSSQFDDSEHVLGVWVPYAGNYGAIRTQGVCDVFVDADKGTISKFDYLSTSDNGCFKKGTIGTGKCIAIALDVFAEGKGYIKALLVSKI